MIKKNPKRKNNQAFLIKKGWCRIIVEKAFNNEIIEVHTFGEFIDQEKELIVISVKENKIIVTLKK